MAVRESQLKVRPLIVLLVLAGLAGAVRIDSAHTATPVALPPPVARPNPATFALRVDYQAPLLSADGGFASLPALSPLATAASFADLQYLAYQRRDDLGGFVPAPTGSHALSSGGHDIVGILSGRAEIPLFGQAAGGGIKSYTFTGGRTTTPPDNGVGPVRGLGKPPVVPPPTTGNGVPPANGGFGGRPTPGGNGGGTTTNGGETTTRTTPTATTTTRTTTTTPTATTTTTSPTTTTTAGGGGTPPPPPPPSCGVPGIAITSDLANCQIYAINMAPGDSTLERLTITNTSASTYTLALRATGTQNRLWQDMRMGVWEDGTAAPSPLPPLLDWTTQFNNLTTLAPGQTVVYLIELFLPTSAGNEDQNLAAIIGFRWRATE